MEDIREEDPKRHYQTTTAPQSYTYISQNFEYTLDEDVQNLEFRYLVGSGGGHRLYINNFHWTIDPFIPGNVLKTFHKKVGNDCVQ